MDAPHIRSILEERNVTNRGTYDLHVEFTTFRHGTSTEVRVSVIPDDGNVFYGEGWAFLDPGDHYSPDLGEEIAFTRAVVNALGEAEHVIIAKVKTEEQHAEEKRRRKREKRAKRYEKEAHRKHECCGDPNSVVGYGRSL